MKKRILATVLTLVLATGTLAGCGKAAATTGETATAAGTEAAKTEETAVAAEETASADVKTLKVGIIPSIPGNSYIDDDGNLVGMDIDILNSIDELLPEYTIEFVQLDGTALFSSLDANKVDFVCGNFRRSDAREAKYIHAYRSYFYTPYQLVSLKENGELNTLADYEGKSIGTGDGSLMADIIEQYIEENNANIEIVYVTDSVGELIAGRVDGIAGPRVATDRYLSSYPDVDFYVGNEFLNGSDECMGDANAYYYFRQGDEELRNTLSEAVYALRQSGKLLEYSEKWYGKDYVSDIDVEAELQLIEDYGITDAAK